jgi:hypothetical protein
MPGANRLRRLLHRFVPAGFHDPVGLARRLVRSRDPAALFALRAAALGPLLAPLDLLLVPFEHRRYRRAGPPIQPIVLVCGCARSGTTVAAQLLLHHLPVSYFSNLTSVFPRSPLTAESWFRRPPRWRPDAPSLHNFYGRTSGWSGPNDALYLWDRWLGSDRASVPAQLDPESRAAMTAFFGARERQTGLPALGKVNALDACAHLVAEALPTARFVLVQRARVPLAVSLLKARQEIHGRPDIPYGLMPPGFRPSPDPVEDVCRQVLFHEEVGRQQLERLGRERMQFIQFEDLCRNPREFVERIGGEFLGASPLPSGRKLLVEVRSGAPPAYDAALLARVEKAFERLTRTS